MPVSNHPLRFGYAANVGRREWIIVKLRVEKRCKPDEDVTVEYDAANEMVWLVSSIGTGKGLLREALGYLEGLVEGLELSLDPDIQAPALNPGTSVTWCNAEDPNQEYGGVIQDRGDNHKNEEGLRILKIKIDSGEEYEVSEHLVVRVHI